MRRSIVAGNWKMNGTKATWSAFVQELKIEKGPEVRLFLPALLLEAAVLSVKGTDWNFEIGAQNAHGARSGAFTGELSGLMLKECGVHSVLLGHSERRQFFGETHHTLKERACGLLEQGFEVVFCIGESLEARSKGETWNVLSEQLEQGLPEGWSEKLIVAYEPVWAIGTGQTATPDQAQEVHAWLRQALVRLRGDKAKDTPLLYGGSVTPQNFASLLQGPDVDGALVGGASLKADSFTQLVQILGG
jgi:triosephosphate isomerase (TIM)